MGRWLTPADDDVRIYLIPVDGGAPTQVYSDTRLLRISDVRRAVAGTPRTARSRSSATEVLDEDNGFVRFENSDQVWTVPATAKCPDPLHRATRVPRMCLLPRLPPTDVES